MLAALSFGIRADVSQFISVVNPCAL